MSISWTTRIGIGAELLGNKLKKLTDSDSRDEVQCTNLDKYDWGFQSSAKYKIVANKEVGYTLTSYFRTFSDNPTVTPEKPFRPVTNFPSRLFLPQKVRGPSLTQLVYEVPFEDGSKMKLTLIEPIRLNQEKDAEFKALLQTIHKCHCTALTKESFSSCIGEVKLEGNESVRDLAKKINATYPNLTVDASVSTLAHSRIPFEIKNAFYVSCGGDMMCHQLKSKLADKIDEATQGQTSVAKPWGRSFNRVYKLKGDPFKE